MTIRRNLPSIINKKICLAMSRAVRYGAPMKDIAIATCQKFPALTPGDAILARALGERGARVVAAPWNGSFSPFADADLTVVRSTWDYFDVAEAFSAWIARFGREARILNPPALLRWSMTKAYLFALAEKGAPVPKMQPIAPTAAAIGEAMDMLDLDEAIVKPLVGGTASGLSRVHRSDGEGLSKAASILNGEALVMGFIPEIATLGETSFIFLGGEFSHAVAKTPKDGDIRVQEDHGGKSQLVDAPDWAIAEAAHILSLCPQGAAYARVDAIVREARVTLMEVELVEPELFFTLYPEGAERLADHLLARI